MIFNSRAYIVFAFNTIHDISQCYFECCTTLDYRLVQELLIMEKQWATRTVYPSLKYAKMIHGQSQKANFIYQAGAHPVRSYYR